MKTLLKAFFSGTILYLLGGVTFLILSDEKIKNIIESKILIIGSVFFILLTIVLTLLRISYLNKSKESEVMVVNSNEGGIQNEEKA